MIELDLFGFHIWWEFANRGAEVYFLRTNNFSFFGVSYDTVFGWKIDLLGFRLTDYDYGDIEL